MLTIGCHLSTTKGYRAMGETALSIGAILCILYAQPARRQGERP